MMKVAQISKRSRDKEIDTYDVTIIRAANCAKRRLNKTLFGCHNLTVKCVRPYPLDPMNLLRNYCLVNITLLIIPLITSNISLI